MARSCPGRSIARDSLPFPMYCRNGGLRVKPLRRVTVVHSMMKPDHNRPHRLALVLSLPGLLISAGILQIGIALIVYRMGVDRTLNILLWILAVISSTGFTLLLAIPRQRRNHQALETLIAARTTALMNANAQLAREIEERKQVEAALRQRESTLEKIQQIAHTGSWEADIQTQQITWSEELYRIHGLDPNQPPPNSEEILRLLHPEDLSIHRQQIYEQVITGKPFAADLRIIRSDGGLRFLEARGEPVFDEHHQLIRYIGMSRDLTERKLTEEKLRKSEALLREAQEFTKIGSWENDLITGQTIWTEGLYRIHGRDPQTLPPNAQELLDRVIYPEDLLFYRQQLIQKYLEGQPFECDFRIIREDGDIRWVTSKGEPIVNSQGQIMRYVGILLDITDRKQAEEKLRQSETTNRALVQAIPDLLIRIHRNGTYLDVFYGSNVRVFNLEKAQIDQHINEVLPLQTAGELMLAIQQVLETQQIRIDERQVVFNQNIYYEETRIVPYTNDEVLVIVRDVSDRKRIELELQQAKEAAEAANRAKSIFLSSMSHELRTPLNAILGFAQLLNRDQSLNPKQQRYIDTINRNGQHLLELINDVLEVSKIEANQVALHENNFDLYQLLENIEELFQLKAIAKNITLTVSLSPTVPQYIHTDESKLRQVLINLLSNAVKFTFEGQVILRVREFRSSTVSKSRISGNPYSLYFEVQDTASGIATEELAQLFKPFSQTQSGRQVSEGTGLGLVISRRFVELMGGKIGVNSTPGKGSTFWFTIQVQPVSSDRLSVPLPNRKVLGLEPDQPTYRILVVEDQPENAQFLKQLLSIVGFEVEQASNGQEGIILWETWKPHLILMDMRMPLMDGYAASQAIKATPQGQKTVIIAATGSAFEEDRARILAIGCDDFIRKPFQENLLFAKISHHLGVRYRYEDAGIHSNLSNEQTNPFLLSPDVLTVMQSDWVTELNKAARECDQQAVFDLLNQISPEYEELAIALKQLATDFRFEEIAALTRID